MSNVRRFALTPNSLKDNTIGSLSFSFEFFSKSHYLPKISRFINKYLYNLKYFGLGSSLDRYSNTLCLYSSSKDKELYKNYGSDSLFLNIGSGGFYHQKWLNFDFPGVSKYYQSLQGKKNKDFKPIDLCNLEDKLKFKDNSVDLIYISHVLDHLEITYVLERLKEFWRILKPGGIVRVVLPDTEENIKNSKFLFDQRKINKDDKVESTSASIKHAITDAVKVENEELYNLACEKQFLLEEIEMELQCKNKSINKFDSANPSRRISYLNKDKMKSLALESGYSAFFVMLRGQSFAKPFLNLNVFDLTEPHLSIYLELIK